MQAFFASKKHFGVGAILDKQKHIARAERGVKETFTMTSTPLVAVLLAPTYLYSPNSRWWMVIQRKALSHRRESNP